MLRIHREGTVTITVVTLFSLLTSGLLFYYQEILWLNIGLWATILIFWILVIRFFRNPKRHSSINHYQIVAPADGKVVIVEETEETEYFKDKRIQVSIFMSPLNVHVNRNPVSGRVKYYKYHPGKYLFAWHPKSSLLNERNTLVTQNALGIPILYRQIAGAAARRIVCYVKEGDIVQQGQEYGFIKFGSRLDLFLPKGVMLNVRKGDKTKGGVTIIGAFPKDPDTYEDWD